MNEDTQKERPPDRGGPKKKTYSFELSLPVLLGASAILVIGVIWVFIFGVLVGRGYRPEQSLPELARFLPDAPANGTSQKPPEPLKAEDLQFHDALKEKSVRAPVPAPSPRPGTAVRSPEPKKTVKETPARAVSAPSRPERQPSAPAEAQGEQRYTYVYQAASFREKQAAEEFRQKVLSLGLAPEMERISIKGSDWYRINVRFLGTPVETRELKAKLRTIGVQKPLIRSKTPIRE